MWCNNCPIKNPSCFFLESPARSVGILWLQTLAEGKSYGLINTVTCIVGSTVAISICIWSVNIVMGWWILAKSNNLQSIIMNTYTIQYNTMFTDKQLKKTEKNAVKILKRLRIFKGRIQNMYPGPWTSSVDLVHGPLSWTRSMDYTWGPPIIFLDEFFQRSSLSGMIRNQYFGNLTILLK